MSHSRIDIARDHFERAAGDRGDLLDLRRSNSGAEAMYQVALRALMPMMLPYDFAKDKDAYASLDDLNLWAETIMQSRPADFQLTGGAHDLYMERWFVLPRNEIANVYLHRIVRDDKDVMHDHPWDTTSIILRGSYVEHTPEGGFLRMAGDRVDRRAEQAHRLALYEEREVISLFFTGPKVRDWGFHCPGGWVGWQDFTNGSHGSRGDTGRGCGEYA